VKQRTPKIDPRTAPDFFRQVVEMLNQEKGSNDANRTAFQPGHGTSGALISIFARFAELITDRLNRVPEKNFLAFLDLLGASLMPPRSARGPLTFSLAESATSGAVVREGTQVAAIAMKGEKEPAVFETERELVISPANLAACFTRDPNGDRYANHSLLLPQSSESGSEQAVFQAGIPIEHILYFSHDGIFGHPGDTQLLKIKFALAAQDSINVAWDGWDEEGRNWVEKQRTPITNNGSIDLKLLTPSRAMVIGGVEKRWLRCRLIDPISRDKRPPVVSAITFDATFKREDKAIENAFTNSFPVDVNRAFYPFTESPTAGDAFYMKLDEDFAEAGCNVTLVLTLSLEGQPPTSDKPQNAKVNWEFWNGSGWTTIAGLADNTSNLTSSNSVKFPLPANAVSNSVNGVAGYWVRARLETGTGYGPGAELKVEKAAGDKYSYRSVPAAAPRIASTKISYVTSLTARPAEGIAAYNDFTYERIGEGPFTPFRSLTLVNRPAIYLGFELPSALNAFPNSSISLYVSANGEKESDDPAAVEWQYSAGPGEVGWSSLGCLDSTADFTHSGLIAFLPPADFARRSEFGLPLYWVRAVLGSGQYYTQPQISALLFNTVMARHATRIENEVLGSSDGSKNQIFRSALSPVLEGQQLDVRELEVPSATEQDAIKKNSGDDAISIVADEAGRPTRIWVRWAEAPDFYASGPRDRHYVLDHLAGRIQFGDGISGMIPPMASGNIRMRSYRTGGGVQGNKPAGAITELRTTVPYVQGVTNHIAASGGAEAESYESLIERMPRTIRHGGRAVTYEDYEDLAMLASPEVARARCVRFYDERDVGKVALLVVPRSADAKPIPSLEMKKRVEEFIEQRNSPFVQLTVGEPEYVEVSVIVDIAPTSLEAAGRLKQVVPERISRFLHPLVGGFEGEGWGFGRKPHLSDLYYLIEAIPDVDHINSLVMNLTGKVDFSERNLIASGSHEVTCRLQA